MVQSLEFETVDVFTQNAYEGNPLAIVHVPKDAAITQEQKGKIAMEFNLSETIFLHENPEDPRKRRVDIFIPTAQELTFAGHPTIGALCCIGEANAAETSHQSILLHEKCGDVPSSYDASTRTATASIPHNVHIHSPATAAQIAEHQPRLSSYFQEHKQRRYPVVSPVMGMSFALVDLDSVEALGLGSPQNRDMDEIYEQSVSQEWRPCLLGAYFYAIEGGRVNEQGVHTLSIRTRMFVSDVGEDPATGSAACTLASYLSIARRSPADQDKPWQQYTEAGEGSKTKYRYEIVQGVEMGRRSVITVEVVMKGPDGDAIDQMLLQGQSVKVMEGRLQL